MWLQLCSSLDIIEDTEFAITAFVSKEFGASKASYYLATYGLLQALYVQQDAVKHLCDSLGIAHDRSKDYPRLEEIRQIRNNSVGHPTKRDKDKGRPTSFHFITQMTLNPNSFDLVSEYSDGKSENRHISISSLVDDQCKFVSEILDSVIKKLEDDETAHKKRFAMEKLAFIFPQTMNYHFEKVFQEILRGKTTGLGAENLEIIKEAIQKFREAVRRRDAAYDGSFAFEYKMLDYAIAKLERFLYPVVNDDKPVIDQQTAYIFAYFIKRQVAELQKTAQQIDDEYNVTTQEQLQTHNAK